MPVCVEDGGRAAEGIPTSKPLHLERRLRHPLRPFAVHLLGRRRPFSFGEERLELESKGNGIFSRTIGIEKTHLGAKKVVVRVWDDFGNKGEAQIDVIITEGIVSTLLELAPFLVIALIVVAVVVFVVLPLFREKQDIEGLKKRKKEIEKLLSKAQKDYFGKGVMSKEDYAEKTAKLESELNEAKKKLKIR